MSSFVTPPRRAKHPLHTTRSPPGRKVLPNGATASLIRGASHNCFELTVDHTVVKVSTRVQHTYMRFRWSTVANCSTSRGPTRLNGSRCHCKCQAAHASLTPNLYDDKLTETVKIIERQGFAGLSPFAQRYIKQRLKLAVLSPKRCLKKVAKLTSHQKKSSFAGTTFEHQRNVTMDNPSPSNRVDSFLERELRPLEDALANQSYKKKITIPQAMEKFVKTYMELLTKTKDNLRIKELVFEELVIAYETVQKHLTGLNDRREDDNSDIAVNEYGEFIEEARKLLKAKEALLQKLPGAPRFYKQIKNLHSPSIFAPLQALVDNYDQAIDKADAIMFFRAIREIKCGKPLISLDVLRKEIQLRLSEVETQISALKPFVEAPLNYDKIFFGVKDSSSILRTPTREHIQAQMLAQVHVMDVED